MDISAFNEVEVDDGEIEFVEAYQRLPPRVRPAADMAIILIITLAGAIGFIAIGIHCVAVVSAMLATICAKWLIPRILLLVAMLLRMLYGIPDDSEKSAGPQSAASDGAAAEQDGPPADFNVSENKYGLPVEAAAPVVDLGSLPPHKRKIAEARRARAESAQPTVIKMPPPPVVIETPPTPVVEDPQPTLLVPASSPTSPIFEAPPESIGKEKPSPSEIRKKPDSLKAKEDLGTAVMSPVPSSPVVTRISLSPGYLKSFSPSLEQTDSTARCRSCQRYHTPSSDNTEGLCGCCSVVDLARISEFNFDLAPPTSGPRQQSRYFPTTPTVPLGFEHTVPEDTAPPAQKHSPAVPTSAPSSLGDHVRSAPLVPPGFEGHPGPQPSANPGSCKKKKKKALQTRTNDSTPNGDTTSCEENMDDAVNERRDSAIVELAAAAKNAVVQRTSGGMGGQGYQHPDLEGLNFVSA